MQDNRMMSRRYSKIVRQLCLWCLALTVALPAPAADQTERLSLWQAVMALNCDLRAVVTLFYYEDLSIREISAVLGISEAAVKTRLSRGRSRLKQLLHEE